MGRLSNVLGNGADLLRRLPPKKAVPNQFPRLTTSQSTATENNHLESPKTVNASAKDQDTLEALYDSAIGHRAREI